MPPIDAPCCEERVGTVAVAGDLAVGEKSPVSEHRHRGQREHCADMWGHSVSDGLFENGIFLFQK